VRDFLRALGLREAEVSLSLAGDVAMRRLNRETRGEDRTTDVLSFPAARAPGSPLLGDLVISVPVAKRWAARLGRPLSAELELYAAHGLLHLLGHRHRTAAERLKMEALERRLLGGTGLIGRARRSR
jgi:probable rRNA maturation factor